MASPKDILAGLRKELTKRLWIQHWDLDEPPLTLKRYQSKNYPSNAASVLPPAEVEFSREDGEDGIYLLFHGRMLFSFMVQYRFSKDVWPSLNTLPITQLTSLYSHLCVQFMSLTTVDDVKSITIPERDRPIGLNNVADEVDDWLVQLWFDIEVTFLTDRTDYSPDDWSDIQPPSFPSPDGPQEPDEPPFDVSQIDIGLYRGQIGFDTADEETYELDKIITIED